MITEKSGNVLTDDLRPGTIIVHGCNCLGVMGAGVALAVRTKYPAAYSAYIDEHNEHGLKLGRITAVEVEKDIIIVNANTQQGTGGTRAVNYEAVAECFAEVQMFAEMLSQLRPTVQFEIRFPMIGAGLGGGNWKIISTIIDETVTLFPKTLYVL